jgi:probable F420-dependent oxidoreductase
MGPGTSGLASAREVIRFAELADEFGFAHFWVNDHLSWPQPLLDPMVFLAHIAAVTKRIHLGTGVYLLPLRSPVAAARQIVSIDYLSGGRAIFGVGVGGEFNEDFAASGLAKSERGRRTDQSIRLIRRLFSEENVSWHDDFFNFDGVSVLPHPTRGTIPIIAGGRSSAALRRAALLCDGWMPYFMSPSRVQNGVEELARLANENDLRNDNLRVIAHVFVSFADTPELAREFAITYLSRQYGADMTRTVDASVATGPPELCAEFLRSYALAGATDIVIRPLAQGDSQVSVLKNNGPRLLELLSNS